MSSEKKEKKQHKMNFNIKEKLKKTFSKEHLKEVFTGEEQKKHLKQGSYSSIMTVTGQSVFCWSESAPQSG